MAIWGGWRTRDFQQKEQSNNRKDCLCKNEPPSPKATPFPVNNHKTWGTDWEVCVLVIVVVSVTTNLVALNNTNLLPYRSGGPNGFSVG